MKPHEPRPPLLLTMIMKAIVIPRATSRLSSLRAGVCVTAHTVWRIGAIRQIARPSWGITPRVFELLDEHLEVVFVGSEAGDACAQDFFTLAECDVGYQARPRS